MEKGKSIWLKKFDLLVRVRMWVSLFVFLFLGLTGVMVVLTLFTSVSFYWMVIFVFPFVVWQVIYLNNKKLVSISKDLPPELVEEFYQLKKWMNTFLLVPWRRVKAFRTKVADWKSKD